MANNNIDNYVSELKRWNTIEFEWDEYIYCFQKWGYIQCDNMEYFTVDEFYKDLEFWDNKTYKEYLSNLNTDES